MVKFLIERPIAVSITFLALVIVGIISLRLIPVSLLPDIEIPYVTVKIDNADSDVEELEQIYVSRIRSVLNQTSHLDKMNSVSQNGKASIQLKFKHGTNINYAYLEVNEKIDGIMHRMPSEFNRPKVIKSKASDLPAFYLNIVLNNASDEKEKFMELSAFTESVIKRRIEQLKHVALVDITGTEYPEIYIQPHKDKSEKFGLNQSFLTGILKANNISVGNITVKDGVYEYQLKYTSNLIDRSDIEKIPVTLNNRVFKLNELAHIGVRKNNDNGNFLVNGNKALNLAIIKKSNAQMAELDEEFGVLLSELKKDYPRIQFITTRDQSQLLKFAISNLKNTLLLGSVLAFLVLFLFLKNPKAPWLIGITIPVSIIISLFAFYLFNMSINIISLSGLVLGVGMMIDNSIIVIDNIGQLAERDQDKRSLVEICTQGTNEIIRPLITSALTTCAVFIPLVFLSDMFGELFLDQALAVTIGLAVSLMVSITLLPTYYHILHARSFKEHKKSKQNRINLFASIENSYAQGYEWVFKNRILFITSLVIVCSLGAYTAIHIKKEIFPKFDENDCFVRIKWEKNITNNEATKRVANAFKSNQLAGENYDAYTGNQQFILLHNPETNTNETLLYLKVENTNELFLLKENITKVFSDMFAKSSLHFNPTPNLFQQIFASSEPDIQVNIQSNTRNKNINPEILKNEAREISSFTHSKFNTVSFQPTLVINPNMELINLYEISPYQIYLRLKQAFRGVEISQLNSGGTLVPIVISDEIVNFEETLQSLKIQVNNQAYPIREFINISYSFGYREIHGSKNGAFIPLIPNIKKENIEAFIEKLKDYQPKSKNLSFYLDGKYFQNRLLQKEIIGILLISVLLLYFILAAQFESLIQPLIVLIEIPIDIAGAILVLKLGGASLNSMALIGIIVMTGIIINDSILKIDTINRLRKKGLSTDKAIKEAGHRRLKPIIMTSITTILALLPFLFGKGMGALLQQPLALSVIGGLGIGTLVSLFLIPLLYHFMYSTKPTKTQKV